MLSYNFNELNIIARVRFLYKLEAETFYPHNKSVFNTKICGTLSLDPGIEPHQCFYVYKYVYWRWLGVTLAAKMSTGVTPGVNLRNPLDIANEAGKQLKSRAEV